MATEGGRANAPVKHGAAADSEGQAVAAALRAGRASRREPEPPTLEERLFREPFAFNFFQAVRILEALYPERKPVGHGSPPADEIARFRGLVSQSFPPSSIFDLERPSEDSPPNMTIAFLGLYGPSGILPRNYTDLLFRAELSKHPEKHALRDWLDLFNHRVTSLFYRAWEKYRFWVGYSRGEYERPEPDAFTRSMFSMIGLGMPSMRNRLRVSIVEEVDLELRERALAKIDDLALLYYGGLLSQRPRTALGLERLLEDFFQLPVKIQQFRGQWLYLEPDDQSRLGSGRSANQLGVDAVAGQRVFDVQSKFRIQVGPLRLKEFNELLPDRGKYSERKTLFLMSHLARLYVGPEYDFEIQLLLQRDEVPECRLNTGEIGVRLGWNTWVLSAPLAHEVEDAVFESQELVWLGAVPSEQPVHRVDATP